MAKNTTTTTLGQALKISKEGKAAGRIKYNEEQWFKDAPITSEQYSDYKTFEQKKIAGYMSELKEVISEKDLKTAKIKIGTPDGDFNISFNKEATIYNPESGEKGTGAQIRMSRNVNKNPYRENIDSILDMFK